MIEILYPIKLIKLKKHFFINLVIFYQNLTINFSNEYTLEKEKKKYVTGFMKLLYENFCSTIKSIIKNLFLLSLYFCHWYEMSVLNE